MVSWIWWSFFGVRSSQDFCHFLSINLLISGFRSVYGIFLLDICVWSAFFCSFVCPFISLYANVAGYPSKNDAIVFRKSGKEREVNLYLHTCICVWVCMSSGMYKSFNLFIIQAHRWRVSVFECVWFSLQRVSSVCCLSLELKMFGFLYYSSGSKWYILSLRG